MTYASLAALKLSLKITDIDRDDLLTAALDTATAQIDDHCGRRFVADGSATARTWPVSGVVEEDGALVLPVRDIASTTGLVVEAGSTAAGWTAITTHVTTDPDRALEDGRPITALRLDPGVTASWGSQRVRVTARWGWPAVPAAVTQACLIQAARLYRRKDSPEGVVGSAEWGAIRVGRIDPDVRALLSPYQRMGGV